MRAVYLKHGETDAGTALLAVNAKYNTNNTHVTLDRGQTDRGLSAEYALLTATLRAHFCFLAIS